MRTAILLLALLLAIATVSGRRIPPSVNKKQAPSHHHGGWGTPAPFLDTGLALEEDLANDLTSNKEGKEDKTKKVKQVKSGT